MDPLLDEKEKEGNEHEGREYYILLLMCELFTNYGVCCTPVCVVIFVLWL